MSSPIATLVQLLRESSHDTDFVLWTLRRLNRECPMNWPSLASQVTSLEELLAETLDEEARQGLNLLLSQNYFHLNEYPKALDAACQSGRWFRDYLDVYYSGGAAMTENTPGAWGREYVVQIVALCVERYVALRNEQPLGPVSVPIPPELIELIEYIIKLDRAAEFPEHVHKLLLGFALDSKNPEYLQRILQVDPLNLMRYVMNSHELLLQSKTFQQTVFSMIRDIYKQKFYPQEGAALAGKLVGSRLSEEQLRKFADELPNYFQSLCMCHDSAAIADLLMDLLATEDEKNKLRAFQLSFDLFSFGSQSLIKDVRCNPRLEAGRSKRLPTETSQMEDASASGAAEGAVEPGATSASDPAAANGSVKATDQTPDLESTLDKTESILTGRYQARVLLKFSNAQNKTDLGILEILMQNIGARHPILHTMLIVTHSFIQRGTTCDTFLRLNLDWFSKPTLWSKFIATGSLGVVHQTHNDKSFRVLSTYLPGVPGWTAGSSYTDGGALYALGLIHANMASDEVIKYLLGQLSGRQENTATANGEAQPGAESSERSVNHVIQYGASLALGLTAMGTGDAMVCQALEDVLMMDNAIAGEAAALGIGLINMGSGDQRVIESLLDYAHETRHEKIIRACGLGIAFACVKLQEQAETVIEKLQDHNPLLRYGRCFTIGLAYVGTANQSALKRLLHIAVTDAVVDVRQAAVLSISFLLSNSTEQAPKIFKFMADSFNFRVRFAAVLGLGMTCAGTANTEALKIVKAATRDAHDLVRQAAFIALGLLLIECPEKIGAERLKEPETVEPKQDTAAAKANSEKEAPDGESTKEAKDKETADAVADPSETTSRAADKKKEAATKSGTPATAEEAKKKPSMTTPMQVRAEMANVALEAREDAMARIGAILGLGIIDGGGRNCNISMAQRENLVGMVLFSQFWYSYPLLLCLSLSFTPTPLLGVNSELRLPAKFHIQAANCPPSLFSYPPKFVRETKEKEVKITSTLLSAALRAGKAAPDPIPPPPAAEVEASPESMEPAAAAMEEPEPNQSVIVNGSRIVPMQIPWLKQLSGNNRFTPIFPRRKFQNGNIIVLVDNQPNNSDDEFIME